MPKTPEPKEPAPERLKADLIAAHPELAGYPDFYLFHLGGSRYSLVSTGIHTGAVFGYLEGSTLHLYGVDNFREHAGLAWQNRSMS
jgi:hypothetical protein